MDEYRRIVIKDSTERLRSELKRARPLMDQEEIDGLSREELVEIITPLRMSTGQTVSIREPVEIGEGEATGGVSTEEEISPGRVSREISPVPTADPVHTMMQMMMMMRQDEREKEERRLERDEKLRQENLAKEEKLRQENLVKAEKLRHENLVKEEKLKQKKWKGKRG